MDVIFHPLVQKDMSQVLSYYTCESGEALADRFFDEAEIMVRKIADDPLKFHPIDEFRRRANFPTFPYHFIFESRGRQVRITILRHHKRHPRFGMSRR